ncbi:MAG: Uma2 family endonuclease [Gammaproteobacteria bacterium]|nr:Uma2 family endonuclease [Gammaproteobacteria bacterium]
MQLDFNQIVLQPGHALLLKDVSWTNFESILEALGEERASRIAYSRGMLEIMAPLPEHEIDKKLIGDMVQAMLEELGIDFWPLGSTTFKNKKMTQAIEADECFYIEHEAAVRGKLRINLEVDPPPDLAIEIDISNRTRFDNYQKLGVPEFWRYDGKKLEISVLRDGVYVKTVESLHFPNLPAAEAIPLFLAQAPRDGRNAAMRAFRAWVRTFST